MASHNYQVGVLISGSATTFEAFCLNVAANNLPIEVPVLIVDRASANLGVAARINAELGWDIEPVLVDRASFPGGPAEKRWHLTDEQSEKILTVCDEHNVDVVSQQGWLSLTRGAFFEEFGSHPTHSSLLEASLLNNHPGITRDTEGLHSDAVHEVSARLGRAAFTMHLVTEQYDQGEIWAEHLVPVLDGYTAKDVKRAVQASEKAYTAQDILRFLVAREQYLNSMIRNGVVMQ